MFGRSLFKGFSRRTWQRGSVVVGVAFGVIAMAGSAGLAIDIGRAQLAQAKLSSALDAAGLAAGTTLSTTDLDTEVDKYLNANFRGYMDAVITDVDVDVDDSNSVITLSANGHISTSFMRYFGFEEMPISASSEITRATTGLELVMVLDNTGSMAGSRLTALKTAATDMVNILFGNGHVEGDEDTLFVGVVPFAQAVNVGTSHSAWMNTNTYNWGPTSWAGCVDERLNGRDVTDDPPSVELFTRYYWPDDSNNDWITTTTKKGVTTTTYNITSTRGPNKSCSQTVLPMTSDQNAILEKIDDMVAVGNTHVNVGAVWGWRMLSPRWRGLWGGEMDEKDLPLDYNTPKMNKAAIIMTDGENTIDNSSHGAYWYLSNNRLGTTTQATAVTRLNTRLTTVCTAMKNQNIVVYTIAFGSPGTTIQNLLRSCASQDSYFFNSPDSATLNRAFRMIGDSLSNLRVSK
jgi:Flp pilus assembly protein TadG